LCIFKVKCDYLWENNYLCKIAEKKCVDHGVVRKSYYFIKKHLLESETHANKLKEKEAHDNLGIGEGSRKITKNHEKKLT